MNKMKNLCAKFGAGLMMAAATVTTAMAEGIGKTVSDDVVEPVTELIKSLMSPAVALVVAVGMVYCVILGVKYAKCEEPQEREKAKGNLKNAVIGFVLIFVLIVLLAVLTPALESWVDSTVGKNNGSYAFKDVFSTKSGT